MNLSNYANYHVWAGEKIRAILKALTDEEFSRDLGDYFSHNTMRKVCEHMLLAVEFCIALVNDIEPDVFNKEVEEISKLSNRQLLTKWLETDQKYSDLLQGDTSGKITVPPFLGHAFTVEKSDFLLQYITHTTFHRGQVIIGLKKLGKEVVGTDYLHYLYEIAPKE